MKKTILISLLVLISLGCSIQERDVLQGPENQIGFFTCDSHLLPFDSLDHSLDTTIGPDLLVLELSIAGDPTEDSLVNGLQWEFALEGFSNQITSVGTDSSGSWLFEEEDESGIDAWVDSVTGHIRVVANKPGCQYKPLPEVSGTVIRVILRGNSIENSTPTTLDGGLVVLDNIPPTD
ncbi:MAG: hypothetical protein H6581_24665 [Bacteroidia bacterium]|nr:hypothetical protein [Bacteroidia bacterium]